MDESCLLPETILLDVESRDVAHALEIIASAAAERHGLARDVVFRALARREAAGSTGLGAGFAVPHARIAGIDRPLTVLVRLRRAIPFRAPDGDPVSLLLAILVPDDGNKQDHLDLLARVADLFSRPRFRAAIDLADSASAVAEKFRAATLRPRAP